MRQVFRADKFGKEAGAATTLLALALTSNVLVQPAIAQDSFSVSGSVSAAEDNARSPIWRAGVYGDRYEITVTDPGALQFRLDSTTFPFPAANLLFYDPSETDYANDATAFGNNVGFLGNVLGGPSIAINPVSSAGQYQAFVASVLGNVEGDYAFTLIGATLGWGPSVAEEIATLAIAATSAGRIIVVDAHQISRLRGQDSLATRDAVLSYTRETDTETGVMSVTQSAMNDPSMMGEIYAWIDLSGFRAEDAGAGRSYTGRGLQVGADMLIGPEMVAGLSFGMQDLDTSVGAVSQDGVMVFMQPYLAYRAGPWSGEASIIMGHGDFDQTSTGGDGAGETRLAALTATGGYDVALDLGATLTPTIGLTHGRERVEGVSGTLAGAGTETVRFTQLSIGAEISHEIADGEVFAGLHADWLNTSSDTALVSDLLVDDGLTGRLELGLSMQTGGMRLNTSAELSGLGGNLRQTSGSIRFAFDF